MRKLLAILFIFTFLSANTAFGEVLKLPMLVQHYLEHTDEEGVTVFRFLVKHYTGGINHNHQQSPNHHDKLPFKTTDGHFLSMVSIEAPSYFVISHTALVMADLKMFAYNQQNYSNAYLNNIWQPPRFS